MALHRLLVVVAAVATAVAAHAEAPLLQPFGAEASAAPAPWHMVGLPSQKKPFTHFDVVDLDGHHALRVQADESYGNLVHPVSTSATHLAWRWRVDQPLDAADLRTKAGDDTALKVCVSFDLPLEQVPFVERQLLRVARGNTTEPVPAATVCYVWDSHLPAGTRLDNAYTRRIRTIVVESGPDHLKNWVAARRDVAADFTALFGAESAQVPAIVAVEVGADSDNTHGHSLGYVSDLVLEP